MPYMLEFNNNNGLNLQNHIGFFSKKKFLIIVITYI